MTDRGLLVNDVHSQLNATMVRRILRPAAVDDVRDAVLAARAAGRAIAIAGGRHAMGGQQFGAGLDLLDMTGLDRVLDFDPERGEVEAEAGIMWPALIAWLHAIQEGQAHPWGIIQKQTGADRLTLGGALSANVHGRVLGRGPIVDDVVAFTLVDADGVLRRCSRGRECFALPAGHRRLRAVRTDRLGPPAARAAAQGAPRGDPARHRRGRGDARIARGRWSWLRGLPVRDRPRERRFPAEGICSCYVAVADDTPIPDQQRALSRADWEELFHLSHVDPRGASDAYTRHYLATDGQLYWSDLHQMADYHDGYHLALDRQIGSDVTRVGDDHRAVCAA